MTPLAILIASIIILSADYFLERYFNYKKLSKQNGFLENIASNWVRNPLR